MGRRRGSQGAGKREETQGREVGWQVAMQANRRRRLDKAGAQEAAERRKTQVQAKAEHPFPSVQRHFEHAKVR